MNRNTRSDESYDLQGHIENQTQKAFLIEFTNGKKCWVPKSQCEQLGEANLDGLADFRVKAWFAEKEQLA